MARRYRAIHVALTLQSDPSGADGMAVQDLMTLPGKSETHFYCHLPIRDLQQAQPTADLVLRHIAAVPLALSTIHTLQCSLLLICSGPKGRRPISGQCRLLAKVQAVFLFSLLYHIILSLFAPVVIILNSPLRLILLIHFTLILLLTFLHMLPSYFSSSEPSPYLSSSDVSPYFCFSDPFASSSHSFPLLNISLGARGGAVV
jgi:hypothetical protein